VRHHYTMEQVLAAGTVENGVVRGQVVLDGRDTAENPNDSRHPIVGPAVVVYLSYLDGAVDALVRDR
jgi:hypothetical protein